MKCVFQLNVVQVFEGIKKIKTTKTQRQYYLINTYEILEIAGVKKIIQKRKAESDEIRFLVPYEDLFKAILMCHQKVGHKGRDIMAEECNKKHLNLTSELITRKRLFFIFINISVV